MLRGVNWSGRLLPFFQIAFRGASDPCFGLFFCSDEPLVAGLPLWVVIITVCEAARMLSSSMENFSACRYNSSIVAGGSRDKD